MNLQQVINKRYFSRDVYDMGVVAYKSGLGFGNNPFRCHAYAAIWAAGWMDTRRETINERPDFDN